MPNDFEIIKQIEITELKSSLTEVRHKPSGASILHIGNDDPENLFCLSFRTTPEKSDGVAHILEHTVLCGSEKFPVKDPFFAMHRRSLNTFMNAMTGADFTCYPAASQVPKDFYNLLEVYLDAVFHPKLLNLSFLQEGHRLEFDEEGKLAYKGIVFNEMKGALNSPDSRLIEALNQALYPDITYGINSGGDPKVIPELTYDELKAFHAKYYHPSHCLFFFYGNMPLEGHLEFIEKHCLKGVEKKEPLAPIKRQKRFKQPQKIHVSYPAQKASAEEGTIIAQGFLTCHILEQTELLALSLLDTLLMCTDASPLKHALLNSGLCTQAGSYMDEEVSEVPWVFVMKGCKEGAASGLDQVIRETLSKIVQEGIPERLISSALHQLEFDRTEITGDGAPFGLSLFMRAALLRQHGGEAEKALVIHEIFGALGKKVKKNPRYLLELIEKHLLNNPHKVEVVMTGDPELEKSESEEEKKRLEAIQKTLDKKEAESIRQTSANLQAFQREQEGISLDVLPKVTREDVPKQTQDYPLKLEKVKDTLVFRHDTFTNGITYMDWVYDLAAVEKEEIPLIRLFTTLLPQVGAGGRTYLENLDYIQEHTGGIGVALGLNIQCNDADLFHPTLQLRGKALNHKNDKLFPLIRDLVVSADFTDLRRLKEVILKQHTALENGLSRLAMRYAINLSVSAVNKPSHISCLWHGIEYLQLIRRIAKDFDTQGTLLVEKMQKLQNTLLGLENPHLIITSEEGTYQAMRDEFFYGLLDTPRKKPTPFRDEIQRADVFPQGRTISSPVAFTALAFPTVSYTDPQAPLLSLAANLFENKILHPKIREQGGAYGGGAVSNTSSGLFYFYAYRDPNLATTLQAFRESIDQVAQGHFTESELEEAKLEMIQAVDAPMAPGSRGDQAYSWWREGKDLKIRQTFRDRFLAARREEVIQATRKILQKRINKGAPVVFAGKEFLDRENSLLSKPLEIKEV